jgi:hypothetical protein
VQQCLALLAMTIEVTAETILSYLRSMPPDCAPASDLSRIIL